jgi:hypothetical protein
MVENLNPEKGVLGPKENEVGRRDGLEFLDSISFVVFKIEKSLWSGRPVFSQLFVQMTR